MGEIDEVTRLKHRSQGIMLYVKSTRREERPKATCPKRAPKFSRARFVRSASLAPFASRFRFLIPFASAPSAQSTPTRTRATDRLRSFHSSIRSTLRHHSAALRLPHYGRASRRERHSASSRLAHCIFDSINIGLLERIISKLTYNRG